MSTEAPTLVGGEESCSITSVKVALAHAPLVPQHAQFVEDELYYLDKPDQNLLDESQGKLPFHLQEYGTDNALKATLVRIVREYISAFDVSKEAGRVKEFFGRTITGFCLDIRVRDLVTWVVMFSGLETLDILMEKYTTAYRTYQKIIAGVFDLSQTEYVKPALEFIMKYHARDPCNKLSSLQGSHAAYRHAFPREVCRDWVSKFDEAGTTAKL